MPVENAKARTAIEAAALTALLEELQRTRRVPFDRSSALVCDSETGACIADTALAGLIEKSGRVAVVLKDVLALLEPDSQLITGAHLSRLARAAETLGLGVSRVTGREDEDGRDEERPKGYDSHEEGFGES